MRRRFARPRGLGVITAIAIACGCLAVAGESAQATVTCPTVSASGVVTPAPTPGVDWSGCLLTRANLTGANLSGANLSEANLAQATLTGANLSGTDLASANLGNAQLTSADISGADLTGAWLSGVHSGSVTASPVATLPANWTLLGGYLMGPRANLAGADLTGLDLSGVDLVNATITNTNIAGTALAQASLTDARTGGLTGTPASLPSGLFIESGYLLGPHTWLYSAQLPGLNLANVDLSGSILDGANLSGTNLAGADLANAAFAAANLTGANLTGATATGGTFAGATLTSANLTGVNLSGVLLVEVVSGGITGTPAVLPQGWQLVSGYLVGPEASLEHASLAGVNLAGADLGVADLRGADLSAANLTGASMGGAQLDLADLAKADLSDAFLETASMQHANLADANLGGANLGQATLSGATVTGATFAAVAWYDTVCPDGTNSNAYVAGCFSALDTTPPTVTVTGVSSGKVYITGAVTEGCKTTDDGTVAIPAKLTVTTTGKHGVGRFTATCAGAVDLAGNQQKPPVSVTFTVAYGLHGFIAPANGSTIARSSRTIMVRFRLTNASGTPISASLATALAAAHDVRATLRGPGIKAVTANCTWSATQRDLACAIRVPSGVRTGSAQKYTITATENVGTGFLTVPGVRGADDPEVVHFR
jgi:uncharacterized protein YjbI with pentapeptide repeats